MFNLPETPASLCVGKSHNYDIDEFAVLVEMTSKPIFRGGVVEAAEEKFS